MTRYTCNHTARRSGASCGKPAVIAFIDDLDTTLAALRDLSSPRWSTSIRFACPNPKHWVNVATARDLTDPEVRDALDAAYADRAIAQEAANAKARAEADAEAVAPEDTFTVERRTGYDGDVEFVVVRNGDRHDRYTVTVSPPRSQSWMRTDERPMRPASVRWSSNWSGNGVRRGPGPNEAMAMANAMMRASVVAAVLNGEAGLPNDCIMPAFVDRTDVPHEALMAALA